MSARLIFDEATLLIQLPKSSPDYNHPYLRSIVCSSISFVYFLVHIELKISEYGIHVNVVRKSLSVTPFGGFGLHSASRMDSIRVLCIRSCISCVPNIFSFIFMLEIFPYYITMYSNKRNKHIS